MMVTISLSGCLGGGENDTSELEQQITDLENSKEEINQNLSGQNLAYAELQRELEELRLVFEQTELITMARRAKKHCEALALENDDIRNEMNDRKHNEKFTVKGRNFMYFKDTHEYKR